MLFGEYHALVMEINIECQGDFVSCMRMQPAMFHELLQRIAPRIQKSTRYRKPLEPGLKLPITLSYLATSNSYKSLQYSFRVAHNTILLFFPEVCEALIDAYQVKYLPFQLIHMSGKKWLRSVVNDGVSITPAEPWMENILSLEAHAILVSCTTTIRVFSASSSWPWLMLITTLSGLMLVLKVHHRMLKSSTMDR